MAQSLGTAFSECGFYLFIGSATASIDRGSSNSHFALNEFIMRLGLLLLANVIAHKVTHYLGGREVSSLGCGHESVA